MRRSLGVVVTLLGLLWVSSGNAQVTGTISGTVTDSTGAVVTGATVIIQNEDTGISRTAQTNSAGRYSAPSLSLGNYKVTASLEGFQTGVRSGIVLTVGREAAVDFQLTVGTITQTVEVTGEAPLVNTASATVGYLVTDNTIRDLPLNGRDLTQLLLLNPGVVQSQGGSLSSKLGYGRRVSISGSRGEYNAYLLDGSFIGDFQRHIPAGPGGALLGTETVREFEVVTNPYSAQYGRVLGGVFNAASKSGTNEWHGGIYEFLRNSAWDARDFFDKPQQPGDPQIPPFRRNQFGATWGGPVRRDKAFFFLAYEGLRESLSTTRFTTVPDRDARKGIVPVITNGVVTGTRQVQIHPFIQRALAFIPEPSPGGAPFIDGTSQFIFQGKRLDTDDFGQGRADYQFSENDSFFGRFTGSNSARQNDGSTPDYKTTDFTNTRLLTLSETRILSPRMLNTFQVSFNRVRNADGAINLKVPPELLSVPGADPPVLGFGFGADSGESHYASNRYNFQDDITFSLGGHSLRWGGMTERLQTNIKNANREQGTWSFSNLENFLIGNPRQYRGTPPQYGASSFGYRQWFFALYLQDDWRVTPRLTLNLGLRWEPNTLPIEVHNLLGNLIQVTDPGLTFGTTWRNHSWGEFGPRFGFAWSPKASGTTSVRGGVGLFHAPLDSQVYWSLMTRNWPTQPEFQYAIAAADPKFFPDALAQIAFKILTANHGIGQGWDYENSRSPRAVQYSVSVQQQLGGSNVLSIGYTANRSDRTTTYGYYNLPAPVFNGVSYAYPANVAKINPVYEQVAYQKTNGNSWYHGLLLSFQRKFSAGLQAQVSYTFSKMIDYNDADTRTSDVASGGSGIQKNAYDFNAQRGLSGYDIRNVLSLNYSYDLPLGRGWKGIAGRLFSGWQLTGIVRLQDGQPFWITRTAPTALNNLTVGAVSPNLAPGFTRDSMTWGARNVSKDPTGQERYYNPAAFVSAGNLELGNLGRNTMIGPGLANWNFSLAKNFAVTERWRLDFRTEIFNLLNRANFSPPAASVFDGSGNPSGTAGVITSTIAGAPSRQIQFGLKLVF